MTTFLTVKEASRITGKSPSSVRRIIYPIIHDDAHPDRSHIEPTVEEVMALRMKGDNFAWRLSEELLRRELPADTTHEHATDPARGKSSPDAHAELLSMLRRELDIKNQQISQQGELISKQIELVGGLSERLREGNVLIASLQQRLALTDGRSHSSQPTDAKRSPSAPSQKGSTIGSKAAKPKKSFFARLFR